MPLPPNASSPPTHYELLQLPVTASLQELRQAFRHLSKRYHPDTTTLPAPLAEESFRRLRHAYTVLSDPQRRQAYDAQLRQRSAALVPTRAMATPLQASPRQRPDSVRRALSGGEWFALLLLGVALVLSLVLGIGVAWMRGAELVQRPSWWGDLQGSARPAAVVPAVPAGGGGSLADAPAGTATAPSAAVTAPASAAHPAASSADAASAT